MNTVPRHIRKDISDFFHQQRFLVLHFGDEGLRIYLLTYNSETQKFVQKSSRFFKNVTEQNFHTTTLVRIVMHTAFFPFRYNIIMTVSHEHALTRQHAIELQRINPKNQITAGEIESYFSHHIPNLIEKNKKITITKCDTDDLNVLLTQSAITNIFVDKKCLHENQDDVFNQTGTRVHFDIVQTFVRRSIFMALTRILSKRGSIYAVYEDAVSLALSLYQRALADNPKEVKPFLCVVIKETATDVVAYNGTSIVFIDSFNFGYQSLYETLNAHLYIDRTSFMNIIKKLTEGAVSPKAKKYLEELLDQELSRLRNGIMSFKKSTGIKTICIDGGALDFYLQADKKFQQALIAHEDISFVSGMEKELLHLPHKHTADIFTAISVPRKNNIQGLGIKYIRWLIPHHMGN